MSQDLLAVKSALTDLRAMLQKQAFMPMPPDMPQQPQQMDPAMQQQMMAQQGGMPQGQPMDPAMQQQMMAQGGQMPQDPAAQGGQPPQDDQGQIFEQIIGALQETQQVLQEQDQRIAQMEQGMQQMGQMVQQLMTSLQDPAPMSQGVQQ